MALRLERFHQQLVLPARFENVDAAAGQHRDAVLRFEFQKAKSAAKTDASDLGIALLQGEVAVSAGGHFDAGDFPGHPNVGKFGIEHPADGGVQFSDAEDAALGNESEKELFQVVF